MRITKNNNSKNLHNKENSGMFEGYKLPGYLNKLLDYIEEKKNITYVTVVVHIKKNTFSYSICSDVTYRNGDGTVDMDMNALQSKILIDALPEHVQKSIEAESEFSIGFTYEDLKQLYSNRFVVEGVESIQEIISNRPDNVQKIIVKDEFFYTAVEYYDNQNTVCMRKHVEYITDIPAEDSPYPIGEIEISNF